MVLLSGWYELIEAEKQKKDVRKLVLPSHGGSPSKTKVGKYEPLVLSQVNFTDLESRHL